MGRLRYFSDEAGAVSIGIRRQCFMMANRPTGVVEEKAASMAGPTRPRQYLISATLQAGDVLLLGVEG